MPQLPGFCAENTFIGSLRVALSAAGEDVSYDHLMGVSGAAFRLQIAQPDWCPSAPDATVGFNCAEPAMKALRYSLKSLRDNNMFEWLGVKKMKAAIVSCIDQGRPVVAINLDGGMDWCVIAGYDNGGKSLLCRTYDDPGPEFVKLDQEPRLAGRAMIQPNAWCYYSLYDARAAAARYLGSVKKEFKDDVAAQLATAEELYRKMATLLGENQLKALFPHQLKGKPWTKEMRHAEAGVLKEVLALEREAIGIFEAILSKA